jgi:hypothetical protein
MLYPKLKWAEIAGDGQDVWRVCDGWQIHFPSKTGWYKMYDGLHFVRIDVENNIGVMKYSKTPEFVRKRVRQPTIEEQEFLPYFEFIGHELCILKKKKR